MADVLYKSHATPTATETVDAPSESRIDPFTGRSVIFAPGRGNRPIDFQVTQKPVEKASACPFCFGHETSTPPAVWIGRVGHSGNAASMTVGPADETADGSVPANAWSVRVVPNRFPAVEPRSLETGSAPDCSDVHSSSFGLFDSSVIAGGHEVVIESPDHVSSLAELSFSNCELVLAALQARIRHWSASPGIEYISVFKNVGAQAGASLFHGHSQVIATTQLPTDVRRQYRISARYQAQTGTCMQCDVIRAERKRRVRVVAESEDAIAYCPFASPMPMTVRITSRRHHDRFDQLDPARTASITRLLRRVIFALRELGSSVAYNIVLNTRPPAVTSNPDAHHWSIDVTPRINRIAGFELGSGSMINQVFPEAAAALYRETMQSLASRTRG